LVCGKVAAATTQNWRARDEMSRYVYKLRVTGSDSGDAE
jgi:hypothetical protein